MFDRAFVIAAVLIGSVYVLIIWIVTKIAGPSVAGVAGVALTALATAIFKQFETLRFKRVLENESRTIAIPPFNSSLFVLGTFAILGMQQVFGSLLGMFVSLVGLLPKNVDVATAVSAFVADNRLFAMVVAITAATHLTGGFLIGKSSRSLPYTCAITASLTAFILPLLLNFSMIASHGGWNGFKALGLRLVDAAAGGSACLLYVFAALVGSKLGFRKQLKLLKAAAQAPTGTSRTSQ